MTLSQLLILAAIFALLFVSAFFSGSETSMTAASRPRMHKLTQEGDKRAKLVKDLWHHREHLIGAILLGNNLVNILASALATSLLISLMGDSGVVWATLGMTLLILIFAEVLPKTYALHHSDKLALAVAPILKPLVMLLGPVTLAIQWLVRVVLHVLGIRIGHSLANELAEEELRGAIELHADAGEEEEQHERAMLRSILDLADVEVSEIMIHRRDVVTINLDQPAQNIVKAVLASPFTRIPVWRENADNIVGVLHAKALLRAVHANQGLVEGLEIGELATKPWFIPDTTDLLAQLHAFRARHEHFAIVVDEYGEMLGIVTLEDILEEIVGDIADEHDDEIAGVTVLRDGGAIVDGKVTLRDLNRRFDWKLPDEEASTIAGLLLHEARRIPDRGQVFVFHGFRFEVLERKRNQIVAVQVRRLPKADDPPGRDLLDDPTL